MNISVAIVEDQSGIREMLGFLINSSDGYTCVATFQNAEDAIAGIPDYAPDVALVDIHLPGQSGIWVVQQLKDACPTTHFVMCTSLEDTTMIFAALQAGAVGYLLTSTPPDKILEAITDAHSGGAPMSSTIARKVVASFNLKRPQSTELEKLTAREREILELLSKGFRYKEIAGGLQVSIETVRKHIHNIYQKLQVTSRTDALNKVK